jgi:branched-chain amino acid transport system substrate-binding protein
MGVLEKAGIPQFCSSEAPKITQQGNKNIFRLSLHNGRQAIAFGKVLGEVVGAKNVAIIYANDIYGKSGADSMKRVLEENFGVKVVSFIATEVGQVDYAGEIARIKKSGADLVYSHQHEEGLSRFLVQFHKLGKNGIKYISGSHPGGFILQLIGEEAAKSGAANGYISYAGMNPVAPGAEEFVKRYVKEFDRSPIDESLKTYIGLHVVKETVERVGSFDQQAFRDTLHGATITTKDEPNVLWDLHYDENGDIDRPTAASIVENGKDKFFKFVPPVTKW